MRWIRLEREITFQHVDSGLYELRRVIGWECSACQHTNWAPRHPGVGCWSCQGRDEEFGTDAIPPADHKPGEVLEVQRPPEQPQQARHA